MGVVAAGAVWGAAWGFVMALLAWRWEGSEIVLLQGWLLAPAWVAGRVAARPATGALAGLALVAGAVWAFELLPMWGIRAAAAGQGLAPSEVEATANSLDATDIALVSTLVIGALVGLGGALLRSEPQERPEPPPADPSPPPVPAPAPLWAGFDRTPEPEPERAADPEPVPVPPPAPVRQGRRPVHAVAAALLLAGLATDFFLDRLFGFYSDAQFRLAIAFLLAGLLTAAWIARRYVITAALGGLLLAAAFAAIQDAEYNDRSHEVIGIVR